MNKTLRIVIIAVAAVLAIATAITPDYKPVHADGAPLCFPGQPCPIPGVK